MVDNGYNHTVRAIPVLNFSSDILGLYIFIVRIKMYSLTMSVSVSIQFTDKL